MGMFDTFRASAGGRGLGVKVKDFACMLENDRIGDQVHYGEVRPSSWCQEPYVIVD